LKFQSTGYFQQFQTVFGQVNKHLRELYPQLQALLEQQQQQQFLLQQQQAIQQQQQQVVQPVQTTQQQPQQHQHSDSGYVFCFFFCYLLFFSCSYNPNMLYTQNVVAGSGYSVKEGDLVSVTADFYVDDETGNRSDIVLYRWTESNPLKFNYYV
jgi:hypothetical protein